VITIIQVQFLPECKVMPVKTGHVCADKTSAIPHKTPYKGLNCRNVTVLSSCYSADKGRSIKNVRIRCGPTVLLPSTQIIVIFYNFVPITPLNLKLNLLLILVLGTWN
jgi:hypothetical protein